MHYGTYAAYRRTWLVNSRQRSLIDGAAIKPSVLPACMSVDVKRVLETNIYL